MEQVVKRNIKLHVRKGDRVKILSGKYKNEQGVVVKVFPTLCRATVGGINLVSKHVKPSAQNPKGDIIKKEAPIHISNMMVLDQEGNPTRIGRKLNDKGKLQRYSKKTGNFITNGIV